MNITIELEVFQKEWLQGIIEGNPSTLELGRRFARKLVTQWLDVDESSDDIVYCDGSGDGGIDIAYLHRGDSLDESTEEGDTWYLVQSKYGKAFSGTGTLLSESQKIIDTLDGGRNRLSSLVEDLVERLTNFRQQASERDKMILVFATETALNDTEKRALNDILSMGRNRLGAIFDVEAVSIETIYQRIIENSPTRIKMPLRASDAKGDKLLVGAVKLKDLYNFMKDYKESTGDLDQLYEKNVRRFLSSRRKVNKAIKKTLEQEPENFGLYNNGVTIVVEDFGKTNKGYGYELVEPYVVNGCQTTRTIWDVLYKKLEAGGTGSSKTLQEWKEKLSKGVVILKIVKVGSEGEELLTQITRYTNSQNAVNEKDFLALTSDFRTWAKQIAEKHNLFLEIQRGGWDSQKALQSQNPGTHQFKNWANAFDLLKVYGAGWLGEAGLAFGTNAPFLPKGKIFEKIMNQKESNQAFGVDDLYAAYLLQKTSNEKYKFGREGEPSRRFTRFLYYMVVIDLLKSVMINAPIESTPVKVTESFLKLFQSEFELARDALLDTAIQLIDDYMTEGTDESVYKEPECKSKDVKGYMRSEQLGKSEESSPQLLKSLSIHKKVMKRKTGDTQSPFDLILAAINS
ncbi:AIPR family protein [Lyngbya sp. PCC 8106]|uniref:AIPR family protein n=1 Tax=Lyngbya sp. (strain PCC 8106) TaxID=313612 RepID=UPI0000EAAA04|nr:AIPR family protein [Lyngbya sp. PCC 8106]EAW37526.1 possible abortive infection phage resistance protein [Lyngbya sp. PCC 8106]